MEQLPFETLFAIAVGALLLALTVASSMTHRAERRIPIRVRHKD